LISEWGENFFSTPLHPDYSEAKPASYPMVLGPAPGIKWPGHEAGNPPPSSAEVKNAWSYISTIQCVFIMWCLVKHEIRVLGVVFS